MAQAEAYERQVVCGGMVGRRQVRPQARQRHDHAHVAPTFFSGEKP